MSAPLGGNVVGMTPPLTTSPTGAIESAIPDAWRATPREVPPARRQSALPWIAASLLFVALGVLPMISLLPTALVRTSSAVDATVVGESAGSRPSSRTRWIDVRLATDRSIAQLALAADELPRYPAGRALRVRVARDVLAGKTTAWDDQRYVPPIDWALLLAPFGLFAFSAVGLYFAREARRTNALLRSAPLTVGHVTWRWARTVQGKQQLDVRFRYEADGRSFERRERLMSDARLDEGSPVSVAYDPQRPRHARLHGLLAPQPRVF